MWLLPKTLGTLRLTLPPGQYLLPWYYSDADIDKLAGLLCGAMVDIRWELAFDALTLGKAARRGLRADDALVIVRVGKASAELDEIMSQVRGLHPRYALVRFPVPQETGYMWLEQYLKVPIVRALRAEIARLEHPLAAFQVKNLPVLEAGALTTDPIELVELLEGAIAHRFEYADMGLVEADYRRSIWAVAGRRLGERLRALGEEELPVAVEVMFSPGARGEEPERFRRGAEGLERVGLARLMGVEFSLGPLARAVQEPAMLGALEAALPASAWTEASRAVVRGLREKEVVFSPLPRLFDLEEMLPAAPPLSIEFLRETVVEAFGASSEALDVLGLLRELSELSYALWEVPAALEQRGVTALRWLDRAADATEGKRRGMARVLLALLQMFSARGAGALEEQGKALASLFDTLGDEAWAAAIEADAKLFHAVFLVHRPRTAEDRERAEKWLLEALGPFRQLPEEEGAGRLRVVYMQLCAIAAVAGQVERAQECWAKAHHYMQSSAGAIEVSADRADREDARRLALSERYEEAATVYEKMIALAEARGDVHAIALGRADLARVRIRQGRTDEALEGLEAAREQMEALKEPAIVAHTLNVIGYAHQWARRFRAAEEAYTRSLALSRSLGDRFGAAASLNHLGFLYFAERRYKDAVPVLQEASELFAVIGVEYQVSISLSVLAVALQGLRRFEDALKVLRRAAAVDAHLGVSTWGRWSSIAEVAQQAGHPKEAAEARAKAMSLYRVSRVAGDAPEAGIAHLLHESGALLREHGLEAARKAWNEGLPADQTQRSTADLAAIAAFERILAGDRNPDLANDPALHPVVAVELALLLDSLTTS